MKFLLLPVALILAFLLYRKFVLLIALIALVMVWDYFQHTMHLMIHLDILPFVSLFVTSEYGLLIAIPFILISGIVPEFAAGHFEMSDMLSVIPILGVNIAFAGALESQFSPTAYFALLVFVFFQVILFFVTAERTEKKIVEPIAVTLLGFIFIWRIAPLLSFLV